MPESVVTDVLDLPNAAQAARVAVRLLAAALLAGILGYERQSMGKAAGLRTHMLVALGAALFALVPAEAGILDTELGRVIQGVAAGVGFLGAGTILKQADQQSITGLTTAASVWLTAALGVAAGTGQVWLAITFSLCALVILRLVRVVEERMS
jgi:putative Mg2+ transporter-C (MgtC) family protein